MSNQDSSSSGQVNKMKSPSSDSYLSPSENEFSSAGSALLSAIITNPLAVAKTRLQAQAAGVHYQNIYSTCHFETNTTLSDSRCFPSCYRPLLGQSPCPPPPTPQSSQYKSTLDVFRKVIRQEGLTRLWRGTFASLPKSFFTVGIYMPSYDLFRNDMEEYTTEKAPSMTPYVLFVAASAGSSLGFIPGYPIELARTRMQAFKDVKHSIMLPGVLVKTLAGVVYADTSTKKLHSPFSSFRLLWTGLGAQISHDVPFYAVCWSTLEPLRRRLLRESGNESSLATILGANFAAGLVAGSVAGATTCPLDVAKTRRQIEKDRVRALTMTTRQTLVEIWRDGGLKGLFTGVGPRVARAGLSVGIAVSFYEVAKYTLRNRRNQPSEN